MKFYNDFIGSDFANSQYRFLPGEDDLEKYLHNIDTMGTTWYYRDKKLDYTFNENGHRCKNIDEIDLNNYLLFIGCSHTFGTGVELEQTFPHITSTFISEGNYYNMAVSASGPDTIEYNLLTWFLKIKQRPNLVIIQWPDHSRFCSITPGRDEIIPKGSWSSDFDTQKFITNSESTASVLGRKFIHTRLINTIIDVPIINIIHQGLVPYYDDSLVFSTVDRARDLIHSGINSHQLLADNIIKTYYEKYNNYIEFTNQK